MGICIVKLNCVYHYVRCHPIDHPLEFNFSIIFAGKPSFTKKQADLFFPPDFADDFPVAMQVSELLMFVLHVINSVHI